MNCHLVFTSAGNNQSHRYSKGNTRNKEVKDCTVLSVQGKFKMTWQNYNVNHRHRL